MEDAKKEKTVEYKGRTYKVDKLQSPTYLDAVKNGRFKAAGVCEVMNEDGQSTPQLFEIPYSARLFAVAAVGNNQPINTIWNLTPVA